MRNETPKLCFASKAIKTLLLGEGKKSSTVQEMDIKFPPFLIPLNPPLGKGEVGKEGVRKGEAEKEGALQRPTNVRVDVTLNAILH